MTVQVLNTKKAQAVVAVVVMVPVAALSVYMGVTGAMHAYHTSKVHMGRNMAYTVTDCQAVPGGAGSKWGATVTVHNGNSNETDDYGVQIRFVKGPETVAWTSVADIGQMDSGSSRTLRVEATVNESGSAQVSCVPVFYRNGSQAGDTSPVAAG